MDDLPKEVKEVKKRTKKVDNSAKMLEELELIKLHNKTLVEQVDSIFKMLSLIQSSMVTHLFSLCFLVSVLFVIDAFFSK